MATQPVQADTTSTVSTVQVTAAMGSAGQALPATASSSISLSNYNVAGKPVEYKVGDGAWTPLNVDQGVSLPVDLSATSVFLRKAAQLAAPTQIILTVNVLSGTSPAGGVSIPSIASAKGLVSSVGRPLRLVTFGDSNGAGANGLYTSWAEMLAARSSGALQHVFNGCVSGETAQEIAGRFHRDIGATRPDLIALQIGTNNGNDPAIIVPVLANMVAAARTMFPNANILVCSTFPNNNNTANGIANAPAISAFVTGLNDAKVIYAPTFEALSTSGSWKAGYNVDPLHASIGGTRVAADRMLLSLSTILASAKKAVPNKYNAKPASNWLKNGTFSIGSPVGGVAAGWSIGNAGGWTPSIDSSDPSIVGSVQVLTSGPSNPNNPFLSLDTSGFDWSTIAGKRIWVGFPVKHTYPDDASPAFQLDFLPAVPIAGTRRGSSQISSVHNSGHDIWHYFRTECVIPAGVPSVGSLNFSLGANPSTTQSLTYRFAEIDWGFADDQQPAFPSAYAMQGQRGFDFASLAAGAMSTPITVTVAGAEMGDGAIAAVHQPLQGCKLFAEVTATNTVAVTLWNPTAAAVDVANAYVNVWVLRRP